MIATILAWGAKFTENSLFVADRQRNPDSQSALAKTLVHRARELAEALKVHRIASPENVVIALLIECLQNRASYCRICKSVIHSIPQKALMIRAVPDSVL